MMATKFNTFLLLTFAVVILCGFSTADVPLGEDTEDGVVLNMDKTWFNKTCKNVFCCIDGLLRSLNTDNICLRVEGYGCHLRYQLQKFADVECEMKGENKDTLSCHRNTISLCAYDLGAVLLDTQRVILGDKTCSDSEERLNPTLHCYRQGSMESLVCEMKNDTNDLSSCPSDVADCQYKKERVSCPDMWAPHRGNCYSYIEEPSTWDDAERSCRKLQTGAHLTDIKRTEENSFLSYDLQKAIYNDTEHKIWWTGLRRAQNTRVFQWSDNTTFNPVVEFHNWGIKSPERDVNHCVYIRRGEWFLARCSDNYGYTCKMPAYKSLHCQYAVLTTASPMTTQDRKKQREESAKQVTEELNNVTRSLHIPEETINEINTQMGKLTASVVVETKEASAEAVDAVDNVVDLLASSLNEASLNTTTGPIVIQSEAMVVQVYAVKKPKCDNEPCSGPTIEGKVNKQTFTVDLPESLVDSGATLAISTVIGLEESMSTTLSQEHADDDSKTETKIGSLITSIAIHRWDNKPVEFSEDNPLVLTFSVLDSSEEKGSSTERLCSYWQPEEESWSTDGCTYNEAKSDDKHTTCECTHLTSFAVLMQVTTSEVGKKSLPRSLDYLTYIGCGLSIFCLLLLILIFLIQKMHRSDRNIIHMNLALALLIAQVIFVLGIDQTQNQGACKGIAALLHYFLLSTFFWMLNEAIYLLSKTTSARKRWLKIPLFLGIGWGIPVLIVGITLAAAFKKAYNTTDYCWLQTPNAIWAFVGPALLIIMINTGILIKVIHVFLSLKANMNKKKKERIWVTLRAMLLTLPLLGSTWVVGIFAMDHSGTLVFAYIFVILNSLQGVFIFVLYCVMNDEVKKSLEKRMSIFSTRSSMASTPGQSTKGSREQGQSSLKSPPGSRQTPQAEKN